MLPGRSVRPATPPLGQTASIPVTGESLMKGEIPRLSDASPEIVKKIIKLDGHSMVWAHDAAASDVEAMAPFMAAIVVLCVLFGAPMSMQIYSTDLDGWAQKIIIPLLGIVLWPSALIGAWFIFRICLGRYSDLHFNRRTRKVYSQEGKLQIQLDWDRIRPFAIPAVGPLPMGGLPLWSLTLVEFSPTNPKTWTRQLRVQGLLPDRESCQRVWEAVRRYMDEPPESLPPLQVIPDPKRSWQSAILDFGPAEVFDAAKTPEDVALGMIGRLRRRNWWPAVNPMILFWWTFFWPGPLSTILYERFRLKARLPADWTAGETPAPGEPNPYRSTGMLADEAAGRRKATLIIGLMCGICIAIGGGVSLVLMVHSVLPSMWELWRPLLVR